MRRWLLLLGGLLIWAAHFGAAYAIASISFEVAGKTTLAARALLMVAGAAAAIACVLLCRAALRMPRQTPLDAFWRTVSLAGAVIALIAVVWQTLPAIAALEGTGGNGLS